MAGVSVTTVSRVLNDRPDVNRETRAAVLKVVEECGFVRNANAKNLKQADGEFAAIIVRGYSNPFLGSVTERMLHFSARTNVSFLLEYIDEKGDEFATALRLFNEKRATGFILLGSRIDDRAAAVRQLDIPFVFATVNAASLPLRKVASVCIDDRAMARKAVSALLEQGHRRVAVFGGQRDCSDSLALRYQGALDAFGAHGVAFEDKRYVETRFSIHGAYECAKAFFAECPDTTAVFAMSDLVAIGVIRALRDMGRSVPGDVSVMGFDGIEIGRFTIPTLATVRQPIDLLAEASVSVLLEMMHGDVTSRNLLLDAELMEGESVAPPANVIRADVTA